VGSRIFPLHPWPVPRRCRHALAYRDLVLILGLTVARHFLKLDAFAGASDTDIALNLPVSCAARRPPRCAAGPHLRRTAATRSRGKDRERVLCPCCWAPIVRFGAQQTAGMNPSRTGRVGYTRSNSTSVLSQPVASWRRALASVGSMVSFQRSLAVTQSAR